MIRKTTLNALLFCISAFLHLHAQIASPSGTVLEENSSAVEEENTLYAGDSYTASAPLKMRFEANINEQAGYTYAYEWIIYPADKPDSPLLRRFEADTEYTFYDSGTYGVKLHISYSESGNDVQMEEEFDPIMIVISESSLKVPNAFSPNGDGINDVFKVTYKSLVKFNAYVFNRWGKRIYEWNLSNIDDGWDGTYNGKQVKDGVYFIVVQAKGSDGINYEIKRDINILRGYLNESSSGSYVE